MLISAFTKNIACVGVIVIHYRTDLVSLSQYQFCNQADSLTHGEIQLYGVIWCHVTKFVKSHSYTIPQF